MIHYILGAVLLLVSPVSLPSDCSDCFNDEEMKLFKERAEQINQRLDLLIEEMDRQQQIMDEQVQQLERLYEVDEEWLDEQYD